MPKDEQPIHIALIMDGNRRWARKHQLPVFWGHRRGVHALTEVIKQSLQRKIPYLTVFAFSTENWQRSASEVGYLMKLFGRAIDHFESFIRRYRIKIRFIGDRTALASTLRKKMDHLESISNNNDTLNLTIAINYGSRDEIIRAIRNLNDVQNCTWEILQQQCDTKELPDVDLLIRTSGEQRLSNFLLLQSAYAEIIFSEKLWPEFSKKDFDEALKIYHCRKRNFGK